MYIRCDGIGYNPYTVNIITFSGHGVTFNGDAIAAIPEYPEGTKKNSLGDKELRFINFTDWARKFAIRKNTLTIFILSMCRILVDENKIAKIFANDENDSDLNEYKFLLKDAESKFIGGNPHEGYSVMLFGT